MSFGLAGLAIKVRKTAEPHGFLTNVAQVTSGAHPAALPPELRVQGCGRLWLHGLFALGRRIVDIVFPWLQCKMHFAKPDGPLHGAHIVGSASKPTPISTAPANVESIPVRDLKEIFILSLSLYIYIYICVCMYVIII